MPRFWVGASIFVVALAVRLALVFATHYYAEPEFAEVGRVARSLAGHGTFADAYGPGTGPTAHCTPLYPLMLAVVYRIWGTGEAGAIGQVVLSSTLASLQYALLPLLAEACSLPPIVGLWCGLLAALLPMNFWVQVKGSFEYSLVALLVLIFSVTLLRVWNQRAFTVRRGVILGAATGLMLLATPQMLPPAAALYVAGYFVCGRPCSRTRYAAFGVAQAVMVLLLLAPWTLRNWKELGSPVWGRSNAGLEFFVSNHEGSHADVQYNLGSGTTARIHPFLSDTERARLMQMGEVAYHNRRGKEALEWIRQHPRRFAVMTVERAWMFWFPVLPRRAQTLGLALITVAAAIGFTMFARQHTVVAWFFGVMWLVYSTPTYVFQMSGRLRYAIEWSFFLFAAYLLYRAMEAARWKSGSSTRFRFTNSRC